MKRLIIILVSLILIIGYNLYNNEDEVTNEEIDMEFSDDRNLSMYPFIKSQTNLDILVNTIASSNTVNERGIGFTGEYTIEYASYERIGQLASTEELFELLKHKSPAVRIYAFRCIELRNEVLLDSARTIIKNINERVDWFSGCSMMKMPVAFFVSDEIDTVISSILKPSNTSLNSKWEYKSMFNHNESDSLDSDIVNE